MPPKASVIIFDDDAEMRETTRRLLVRGGHTVIGEAGSIDGLEQLLSSLQQETKKETVALLDNNAPWYDGEEPDSKGVGKTAEKRIKEALTDVITVATTHAGGEEAGYGDYYFNPGTGMKDLSEFIDALPAKER